MAEEKKIAINIDGSAKMTVEYFGYQGNQCFVDAEKLKQALAVYGVDVEVIKVDPKKDELEVRRLDNTASVGA